MPDLVVEVDTQAITNSELITEVDSQVISFERLGIQTDSRVLGTGTPRTISALVDSTARKIGTPLKTQVDSIVNIVERLGIETDSQVLKRGSLGIFIDSQVVKKREVSVQVDSEARARITESLPVLIDSFVSSPVRLLSVGVNSVAVPTGKVLNPTALSYYYPYPPIED